MVVNFNLCFWDLPGVNSLGCGWSGWDIFHSAFAICHPGINYQVIKWVRMTVWTHSKVNSESFSSVIKKI